MSYRKKHVKRKVRNIKPRKPIYKKKWFWALFLLLALFLSVLYFMFFYPGFQVKNIIISGNDKVKTQDLQELILNNINTGLINVWRVKITSQSIFLVNPGKLDKEILEKFPVIEKVGISRDLPETLTFGIVERKPIGAFCSESRCFLIDEGGVIFEQLSAEPENITIVRQAIGDDSIFVGEKIVAENITKAIFKIQKNLKDNFQIELKEALITSPLRLDAKTNEDWQIYFNLGDDSDIDSQLIKLNLLLSGEIPPEARRVLQYIDLRFKDRAFYR